MGTNKQRSHTENKRNNFQSLNRRFYIIFLFAESRFHGRPITTVAFEGSFKTVRRAALSLYVAVTRGGRAGQTEFIDTVLLSAAVVLFRMFI